MLTHHFSAQASEGFLTITNRNKRLINRFSTLIFPQVTLRQTQHQQMKVRDQLSLMFTRFTRFPFNTPEATRRWTSPVQTFQQHIQMQLGSFCERRNAIVKTVIRQSEGDEIRQIRSGGNLVETVEHPTRSEERRVGKECRSRWSPYH